MNTADAYEILQLSSKAHPVMVTRAFRILAAMYHPDNEHTGDRAAFEQVVEAYRLLSDPVRRAAYDRERIAPPQAEVHMNGANGATEGTRRRPESERRL